MQVSPERWAFGSRSSLKFSTADDSAGPEDIWQRLECFWLSLLGWGVGGVPLVEAGMQLNILQGTAWPHNKALFGPKCQQRPEEEFVLRNVSLEGPSPGWGDAAQRGKSDP